MNKYSEKSLDELLSYFGDEFYQFVPTKEDFVWYLTEISHRIIEENGIKQFPQYNFFYNNNVDIIFFTFNCKSKFQICFKTGI